MLKLSVVKRPDKSHDMNIATNGVMKILREALDLVWRSSPDVQSPTVPSRFSLGSFLVANDSKKEKYSRSRDTFGAGVKGQSVSPVWTNWNFNQFALQMKPEIKTL